MWDRREIEELITLTNTLKGVNVSLANMMFGLLLARWTTKENQRLNEVHRVNLVYLSDKSEELGPLAQDPHDLIMIACYCPPTTRRNERSERVFIPASLLSQSLLGHLRVLKHNRDLICMLRKRVAVETPEIMRRNDLIGLEHISPEHYAEAAQSLWTLAPEARPLLPEE